MQDKNKIIFSAQRQVVRRKVKYFQRFLSVCLLLCVAYLAWYRLDSRETARKNQELQRIAMQEAEKQASQGSGKDSELAAAVVSDAPQADKEPKKEPGTLKENDEDRESAGVDKSGRMTGFEQLLQINPDLKGWISIPGTVLSLPVVQGSDNSFYLGHDFYGQEDRHGTLFVDCEGELGGAYNTVIYGHHMRDGSMFGILKEYRKEEFYREHPSFFISLPEEEREYEILAVVRNDIFEGNKENFQYYDYKQIADEETFAAYCQALKENAVYETGVEVQSGDELVTLCTCDYGSTDQRLLVVGRKKRDKQ